MIQKIDYKFLLRFCVVLIFLGRAYQYIFFDAPFRAFLWDEDLLKPFIEPFFNTTWRDYVTNPKVDKWIQISVKSNGVLFLIAAISAIFINKENKRFLKYPISISVVLLGIMSLLVLKERFFQYGQFFENAIQVGVPLVLLYSIKENASKSKTILFLKILVSITFISHGLYAIGFYPIPGHFIDMTINSLGVTENFAIAFLKTVGLFDFIISILIFFPKVAKYALWYAFIWGTLTAFARVAAYFNSDLLFYSLHQTLYLVIYRLPHGLIPLLLLIIPIENYNKK